MHNRAGAVHPPMRALQVRAGRRRFKKYFSALLLNPRFISSVVFRHCCIYFPKYQPFPCPLVGRSCMVRGSLCDAVSKRWLLAATPCVLLLAVLNPELAGRLRLEHTAGCATVFLVFLSAGVRVDGRALLAAWRNTRTVLFVQGCGFVVVPALVKLVTLPFGWMNTNEALLKGVMCMACMGPAVCSGVVLAQVARADEAMAVVSAALGSLLSVPMTPILLLCMCGSTTLEPISRLPLQPLATVVLPLLLGRLLATRLCDVVCKWRGWLEAAPLVLLYAACCDTLVECEGQLDALHVLVAVLLVISTLTCSAWVCGRLGRALLSADDAATAVLCTTQKSIAFALPRLHLLYSGGPLLTLPLLIQQPAQLLLGAAIAVHVRETTDMLPT